MLVIEKGVPIPPGGRATGITATLRRMEVGDSLFVSGKKPGDVGGMTARVAGAKFTSRKVDGGVRIWRTA